MGSRDLREFIRIYGERGYYVLKAILEAYKENWGRGALGDFDFKSVKRKIESYGIEYNPAVLISRLEKEYRVIETTYKSSNQHWWRIVDLELIEEAVAEHEGRSIESITSLPPRARLLRLQFYATEPEKVLMTLKRALRGFRIPQKVIDEILFIKLPRIVNFLENAQEEFFEELSAEISLAEEILNLAEQVVMLRRPKEGSLSFSRVAREVNYDTSF